MEGVFDSLMQTPVSTIMADVDDEQFSSSIHVGSEKLPEMNTRRKTYSKQQWSALKPIIKQLYVNEGQTFRKVAEYLCAHHDFSPTKKQFTQRISEWGFEKNVKQRERRAILEAFTAETNTGDFETRMFRGRKLDEAKIKRWKKKEDIGCRPCSGSQIGHAKSSGIPDEMSNVGGSPLLSIEMDLCSQDDIPEERVHDGEQQESQPTEQESTFNPWLAVDIIGSPDLTGLIGALTIDLCEEIPSLDLSVESSEESQVACELMNPCRGCSGPITRKAQKWPPRKATSPSVNSNVSAFSTYFSKPARNEMPGPFGELYPFPSPAQSKGLLEPPRTDHLVSSYSLKMKELECRTKFKALKGMGRFEIIKMVNEMRSIARRHYELDQYGPAGTWWRRVVTFCIRIPGYDPVQVLYACLQVVKITQHQGRYKEAFDLYQPIGQKIAALVAPDHELAMLSKSILADLRNSLGDENLAMTDTRDLLQISLLRFGTRSREALNALQYLGDCKRLRGQYHEAEVIYSLCLQLDSSIFHYADRDTVDMYNSLISRADLAYVLNQQQKYEDCKTLLHTTNRCFVDFIRLENPASWEYFRQKARVLRFEGRLRESEEILLAILEHAPDYPNGAIMDTMEMLVDILMESGREEEAITLRGNIFSMAVELYGIEHRYSKDESEELASYYANQGRFNDAILHFQKIVEKLAASNMGDSDSRDDYIQDLHDRIAELERRKLEKESGDMMQL
ncbi:hypothetical protein EG329_013973 [Mollisiaceae sp. DMI_Dod_QoI]|nr:hypothetical protein EG329_013973 [Helotiales sp. DMI_Dod_QoI]